MQHLLVLASLVVPVAPGLEGPFVELTYDEACVQAVASNRLVFVDFYTDWCPSCKKMDEQTWPDPQVMVWLKQQTVAIKVNGEKEVALAKRFGVGVYPTLLFVDPGGRVKGQLHGFRRAPRFLAEAQRILGEQPLSLKLRADLAQQPENPHLKMALARQLARELNPAEAFELYLWCFDNGMQDASHDFGVARLTVLLKQIKALGGQYPPVQKAMIERISAARNVLMGPLPTFRAVQDLTALNNQFGQKSWNLDVYSSLIAKKSQLDLFARESSGGQEKVYDPLPAMFERVVDQLMVARRYKDVIQGFGSPSVWVDARVGEIAQERERDSQDNKRLVVLKRNFERKSAWFYRALLAAGEHDDQAIALKDRLLRHNPRVATWKMLMKQARLAGRKEVQRQLREEALGALPEKERGRLRKLAD